MGAKDFTDWNGRKRKEIVRPDPERSRFYRRLGKKKSAGLKTKVDRYKQALKDLALYRKWRKEHWQRQREYERESPQPRLSLWNPTWANSIRWRIKKIRQLQKEYKKDGSLEIVRAAVGLMRK